MTRQQAAKPRYPLRPIATLKALEAALGVPLAHLVRLGAGADNLYRAVKAEVKSDGSVRETFDAFPELKAVQIRIKDRILKRVEFPPYLTGSLKGRDYRVNAKLHVDAAIVVCEDVTNFFPSVRSSLVERIWIECFGFSPDVVALLTSLTTRKGSVPQGAVTSSYLANLSLFDDEPRLYQRFEKQGIRYSRYVDDITISSESPISNHDLGKLISEIYTMLSKNGLRAKRRKHELSRANTRMVATKLVINKRVALLAKERAAIRAAVHQLERSLADGQDPSEAKKVFNSVRGRVDKLKGFHPTEGAALRLRVNALRDRFPALAPATPTAVTTKVEKEERNVAQTTSSAPPW